MTKNQFDRLCERAQKFGIVKSSTGSFLQYWGDGGSHPGYYSVIDCFGSVIRCGTKSEIEHIFVD